MGMETLVKAMEWSIIVLYNPDIKKLKDLIKQLNFQGSNVVLVNNGQKNPQLLKLINEHVFFQQMTDNLGIAAAQNVGISFVIKMKAERFFLFDQDSEIPNNYISAMTSFNVPSNTGMLVPNVLDINTSRYLEPRIYERENSKLTIKFPLKDSLKLEYRRAAKPIASGSYIFVDTINKVGGMREDFFIDAVDTDFSLRVLEKGYEIYRINNISLSHKVGNKRKKEFFSKIIFLSNHSPSRRYYIGRNNIWLWKLHFRSVKGISKDVFLTLSSQLVYALLEKNRISKVTNLIKGITRGIISNPPVIQKEIR